MRCTTVAAAPPTAAAVAVTAAATAAAAVVSFRFYDYFPLQCNYKSQPRRSGRHELMVLLLLKFSLFMLSKIAAAAAAAAATAATVDQLHSILFGVAITSYAATFSAKRRFNNGRRR